jgi:hypothetical protein
MFEHELPWSGVLVPTLVWDDECGLAHAPLTEKTRLCLCNPQTTLNKSVLWLLLEVMRVDQTSKLADPHG